MKLVKVGGLIVGLAIVAVVLYQVLAFGKQAGDPLLATLRSSQRTAEYNEQIAANLAGAKFGDELASLADGVASVLNETTLTLQALRPAIAETAATTQTARLAIAETAAAVKAARIAIEGAKLPDVDRVLRQTDALLEETTALVRDAHAGAPRLLATTERLLDHVDHVVSDSDLTTTLRTTGQIAANIERDQDEVSAIVANTVPVSEALKNEVAIVEKELVSFREKRQRGSGLFWFIARLFVGK